MDALDMLRRNGRDVDLIVTDQTMPRLNGLDFVRELRAEGFELPVVLCTGYSDSINDQALEALHIARCFDKPVNLKQLNASLKRLLHGTRTVS